jgi:hypothetical protein
LPAVTETSNGLVQSGEDGVPHPIVLVGCCHIDFCRFYSRRVGPGGEGYDKGDRIQDSSSRDRKDYATSVEFDFAWAWLEAICSAPCHDKKTKIVTLRVVIVSNLEGERFRVAASQVAT